MVAAHPTRVAVIGVDRPGLEPWLAMRGLCVGAAGAAVALAAEGHAVPALAVVVEVPGPEAVVAALDGGASDAVCRSDPDALVAARLAALVRRRATAPLHIGDLMIDTVMRRVTRAGSVLPLLPREYAVLLHLARHAGQTVSRAALHAAVWNRDWDPGTNVIEVHVSRLRAKLHRGFGLPILLTDKGQGYRLVPAASDLATDGQMR